MNRYNALEAPTFESNKTIGAPDVGYIARLAEYIKKNQQEYFLKRNEADSLHDFLRFPTMVTDRAHLCMPDEPMLIDRDVNGEHWFCVCTISKTGKVMMEIPTVRVEELDRNSWRMGYFLLPLLDNTPSHE